MDWILLSLRRLRDGVAPAVGLALIVAVTACAFAAVPRLRDTLGTDLLRTTVEQARPDQRPVTLVQQGRIAAGTDAPLATVERTGADLEERVPAEVARLVTERVDIVDSQRWTVVRDPSPDFTLRLREQSRAWDHLRLVDGRRPTGETRTIPPAPDAAEGTLAATAFEVAISTETARVFGVGAGDRIDLAPEPADVRTSRPTNRLAADVVGVFEVTDLGAPYWSGDTALDRPSPRALTSNVVFQDATALIAPEAYPALLQATRTDATAGGVAGGAAGTGIPLRYTFRLATDPARLDASRLDALVSDLRRLDTVYPTTDVVAANGGTTNRSDLLALVEAHAARWRSAEAVLSIVVLGTMSIALLALALVALLAARRRRPSLDLARGRGASTSQAFASVMAEGLVLTVPAAVLGGAAAALLVPAGSVATAAALAGGVAAVATALLVAALVPSPAGPPPDPTRETSVVRRSGARRLMVEAVVVVVALAGAWALRSRGTQGATAVGGLPAVDPFVALVPALVGIAAGIVVVRLFPLPVRALAAVAAGRRGLVPAYALRRLARESSSGLILAVLMATATIATFCSVVLVTLDRAADASAWHDVGAPFRITAMASGSTGTKAGVPVPLPADLDPAALPGVEAAAEGSVASTPFFPRGARLDLLALDTAAYAALVEETPVAPAFPAELSALPGTTTAPGTSVAGGTSGATAAPAPAARAARLGTTAAPLPAIVSTALAEGQEALAPGRVFQAIVGGGPMTLRVVEVRDDFPTLPVGGRWAIVDLGLLREAASADAMRPTMAFVRAPDAAAAPIRAATAAVSPDLVVASRAEVAAGIRTSPLMEAVVAGLTLAALVAALYAALAVSCALALSASARAVEVAHLRTLGLSRAQSVQMIVAEHGPTVAVAFVVGALLGIGLYAAVGPALGTDAIVGSAVAVPLAVEPAHLAAILAVVVFIVAVGMAVAAVIQRRAVPALAVRRRMG